MELAQGKPMKKCSACLQHDSLPHAAPAEGLLACRMQRFFNITLSGIIVASLSFQTSFGQNNANNRSAVNSRIGSTLKNTTNTQRNKSSERKPLLQLGNKNDSVTTPHAAVSNQIPSKASTPASPLSQPTQESCLLVSGRKSGSTDIVEVSLEGSGDIFQTNQSGQFERAGIEFVAGFKYEERYEAYSPTGLIRTIREYEQAGMKRKFGSRLTRPLLDSSRKNIVTTFDGKKTSLYCPNGPMKAEQYALLNEVPCNTAILDRLLPNREIKLGESWQVPNDLLCALLGLEAIENNTVYLTLTSIVDNFAEIELYQQGGKDAKGIDLPSTLEGASEGASVGLNLNGKFQFDLTAKKITWLGLKISEHRSESVAAPGLDCNVTLKITVAGLDKPEKLTDDVVTKFQGPPQAEDLLLYYNAQTGPWKFQHTRRWKMIEDSSKVSALCYIDKGEAIAQCNILSNGRIDLSTQPTIEAYKDEIKKGLGNRFAEFKQDAVYEGADGLSIYYVVADGAFEDLPFRWVYYLITDPKGNQATIMFEIRAEFLDRYDDSGNEIVESFRFVPKTVKAISTSEKKSERPNSTKNGNVEKSDKTTPTPQKKQKS